MTDDEQLKQKHAKMWGDGEYERIAATLRPMHDELVRRLAPQAGQSWLDLATGTGEIAVRAALQGARVLGVDLAPTLIDRARALAQSSGVIADFEVGDAERLRHGDGAFDVVASAVGMIFAPDHRAVAGHVARVCRSGGRLGFTAWTPEGGVGDFFRVMKAFQPHAPPGKASSFDWGRPEYVHDLLGGAFDFQVFEHDAPFVAESALAAWEKLSTAYGPTVTLAASLDDERRAQLRAAVIAFYEGFTTAAGVCHPRNYRLFIGRRR